MSLHSDMENLRKALKNFVNVFKEETRKDLNKLLKYYIPTKPWLSTIVGMIGIAGLGYFMMEEMWIDAAAWFVIWGVILYLVAKPSGEKKNEEDTSDRRGGN